MNLLEAIALRIAPNDARRALMELRAAAAAGTVAPGRINKPVWGKQSPTTYMDDAYVKLALVFRCVGVTSTSMAKAILKTKIEKPDGSKTDLPLHPMSALLRQPNPEMRQNRFLSVLGVMASVAGFVVIEKERNNAGQVIALWPLEPHRCSAVLRDHAPADWEYRVDRIREPFKLAARDVIVFTYQDRPDLAPYGIGPVETCFREVGLSNIMTDFLKAFFDGGAMPQHGLVPRQGVKIDQAKADHIKALWKRRHGGLLKSIEPALLENIERVERLSFDMNELSYDKLRNIADTAICNAFGVSPMLVDAMVGMEHSTYSNKEDARKGFYDETISALWDRLDDVLTLGLLSEFEGPGSTVSLEFDTSKIKALQEDRNTKAPWVIQGFSSGGLSQHMMLTELGIAVPKTDDFYVRSIAQEAIPVDDPLGLAQAEADNELALKIAESQPKAIPATTGDPDAADDDQSATRRSTRSRHGPAERRAAIGALNRKTIGKIATKVTPWTRAFFKAQGDRLLKQATRESGIDHETRSIAEINWQSEADELEKLLTRIYTLSGDTAWDAVNDQLGTSLDFSLANPNTQRVRDLLAKEVKDITDESRRIIQDVVSNGLSEGKTTAQITDDLKSKMDGWTQARASTVSRTETMFSYGESSYLGYKESGVVDRAQIFDNSLHTEDYGASDGLTCATRDGLICPLDEMMDHIYADHPNGSACGAPILIGEEP